MTRPLSTSMTKTSLVGILNLTPDSFFDGGKYSALDAAVQRAIQMEKEGADIIDIGGESTRPGSDSVPEALELDRVIPVLNAIKERVSCDLSIDTMKPKVAEAAIDSGATYLNDVSGFCSPRMREIAAGHSVKLIVMHMLGKPKTMQQHPVYLNGVLDHIKQFFDQRVDDLIKSGVSESQIILDPGIGFGKTVDDNLEIIQNLHKLKEIGFPLFIGLSRKSFIGKMLGIETKDRLPATIAMNTICLLENIEYIRVHDVKEHRMVIDLIDKKNEVFNSRR